MKNFLLLLLFVANLVCVNGQSSGAQGRVDSRPVESLYYKSNSDIAPTSELPKVKRIIEQALADTTLMLHLVGYDDGLKEGGVSEYLASNRALYMLEYIKSYGVRAEQLSSQGGVATGGDKSKACRVDIYQGKVAVASTPIAPTMPVAQAEQGTPATAISTTTSSNQSIVDTHSDDSFMTKPRLSISTNLLYWLGGSINAGIEIKTPKSNFGFAVDGGYSPFGGADWRYSLGWWYIAPEVRFYLPRNPRWFVGAEVLYGDYNVKFTDEGYQGSLYGGGVTAGYRHSLNRRLDISYSLGVGYGVLNYDTYYHVDGINVVKQRGVSRGVVMPIEAGVNLIWKLGKEESSR